MNLTIPVASSAGGVGRFLDLDPEIHVDEAGGDDMPASIPGARIGGDLDIGSDGGDDTILDENGGRWDQLARFGDHICTDDGVYFRGASHDPLAGFCLRLQPLGNPAEDQYQG